ncbi:hypothetical protein ColTof4_08864 [Colletotrichum tofieldiae]|nr:hypothetical protein ColTof3_03929 [Colletotrichum tofieldiae]GKT76441.1 hypothetical protein ColTof4_08864 [Colletotrichum tofieldiae]GKT87487.1 hypothetical protein Ct61P_05337 [Colletotrichum tofieldiae]
MPADSFKSYCIWYYLGRLGREKTYYELAQRFPDMRYQVGRTCVATGYSTLYNELNLLPDVSVAEEARDPRDSGASDADVDEANEIYESIISQTVRYAVMDDYSRTVNLADLRPVIGLNGNTAAHSSLFKDIKIRKPAEWTHGVDFSITEEGGGINPEYGKLPPEYAYLLYTSLPRDLPTTRENSLIIMEAYEGENVRYLRLRRSKLVNSAECIDVVRRIQ